MSNITITINAPELVQALVSLANTIEGRSGNAQTVPQQPQIQAAQQYTVPLPPANQIPQTPVPPTYAPQPQQQYGAPAQAATVPAPQSVYQQQIPMPQQPVPQTTVPTAAQTYTLEQLSVAGTQLVDAGRMAELQQLLASFGVNSMMQLPKEQYGAFATQLRAMGAKI